MKIFKYEVSPTGITQMPRDAKLLHVGTQVVNGDEGLFVWALVDPSAKTVSRRLLAIGTGHEMHALATAERYVGSVQFKTQPLVFHVFDLGET